MKLGVRPQDLLTQAAGATVDDEDQVTGGEPEPARVAGFGDGPDARQLNEVVAPADRPEALKVTGGNVALHHGPGRVVGIPIRVQRAVEVGKPGGELLGYGALERNGEHGDATTDVGAHQERIQDGRGHGGADGSALAGMQVRHGGDVLHAVEAGHLVTLRQGIGFDPAGGGGEHGDGGRPYGRPGVVVRQRRSLR